MEGTAWFVRNSIDRDKLQLFTDEGDLKICQIEQKSIRPTPVGLGAIVNNSPNGGFAATLSLHSHFCDSTLDDDNMIRQKLCSFWESPEGNTLLRARFGDSSGDLNVFPTHVTRRNAPPDHLSLVHIDYPSWYGLSDLYREWHNRWKDIIPRDICTNFRLKGVLTVWMALQQVSNFPLCIADLQKSDNLVVYRVGEKKHSVGVHFDERMRWYVCPRMKAFDAWIFDTQHTPHCSVDLCGDGSRVSIEVRCLVVAERSVS